MGGSEKNFLKTLRWPRSDLFLHAHWVETSARHSVRTVTADMNLVSIELVSVSNTWSLAYNHNAGWWKGVKQFLPAKSVEHEETPVRYSNSEVSHLSPREVTTVLQADSAGETRNTCARSKGFRIYNMFGVFHILRIICVPS